MVRSLLVLVLFASVASAQVPPEKALATMKAGDGLQVELFAAEPMLINPTNMDIDPLGRVWITEAVNYRNHLRKKPLNRPEGDRIVILTDTNGDGKADESTVFYQGTELYGPLGICIVPFVNKDAKNGLGYRVLVSQSPDILEFWDKNGDGKADGSPTKFLSGFGGYDHDHGVHSIQVGPDGKFYLTVGDQGFKNLKSSDGKQTFTQNRTDMQAGTVWRCDPDGTHLEMLAHNFRNPYEACVDSFGEIWLSDNDDDGNQQTRICHVMPGGNYGYWPRGKGESHWHEEQPGIVHKTLRTGFGSPTGITCYEGALLPEKFRGQLIHCDAGPREVRCFHKKPKGAGYELDKTLMLTSSDNWFRPSDVSVAPDGSVFVCDWYDPGVGGHGMGDTTRGRIYRITPAGHTGYKVPAIDTESIEGIQSALGSPCITTRQIGASAVLNIRDGVKLQSTVGVRYFDRVITDLTENKVIPDYVLLARIAWLTTGFLNSQNTKTERYYNSVYLTFAPTLRGFELQQRVISQLHDRGFKPRDPDAWFDLTGFEKTYKDFQQKASLKGLIYPDEAILFTYREALLGLVKKSAELSLADFYTFTKHYRLGDRAYLSAINIACGTDPARRDAILADFDKHFPEWNDKVADLVWELRPKSVMPKLEGYLADAKLTAKQKGRIVDILAASPDVSAGKTLLGLLAADQPTEVKAKALENLKLFLPTKWKDLAAGDVDASIVKLIKTGETLKSGLQLIAAANAPKYIGEVGTITKDLKPGSELRQEAITTLGQVKDLKAVEMLIKLALPENADSAACLTALGQHLPTGPHPTSGTTEALDFLRKTMTNDAASTAMKTAALTALVGHKAGGDYLLSLKEKNQLPAAVEQEAGKLLRNSPYVATRNKAMVLFPTIDKLDLKKLPSANVLAKRTGNVEAGRKVFLASLKGEAQCMKCHTVHKEGGAVGPELSAIGKKASREDLFTSILQPSKAIADQFVTWKIETDDGQTVSGLLVKETENQITIRDANGKDYNFPSKGTDKKKSPVSLMPEDVVKAMTEQELVDLVEYLFSLKE